jgi:hypothetical protein
LGDKIEIMIRSTKMLPAIRFYLFVISLLFWGCASDSGEVLTLAGDIDKKVNGILHLTRSGDKITGTFENTDNHTHLELRGTIKGEYLRLEEFAEKDQLTGIFDGKFDGVEYSGEWISPNRKESVPFFFSNRESSSTEENAMTMKETGAAEAIVNQYSKWAKGMNQTEYCTPTKCQQTLENSRKELEFDEGCALSLVEEIDQKSILLGDINGDRIEDGIVTADLVACTDGTWSTNALGVGHLVIFISTDQGGYDIFSEPSEIRKEIENGWVVSIENGEILADGASNSGETMYWDNDITWKSKFKFKNGKFVLISSTEHVQRKDDE